MSIRMQRAQYPLARSMIIFPIFLVLLFFLFLLNINFHDKLASNFWIEWENYEKMGILILNILARTSLSWNNRSDLKRVIRKN